MKKFGWAFGVLTGVFFLSATAWAAAPDAATIDYVEGKKGKVEFNHKKHGAEYKVAGKAISCKECHHTAKNDAEAKKAKKCIDCHVAVGKAVKKHGGKDAPVMGVMKGKKVDNKSLIFHKNCIDCHKKVAKADASKKDLKSCKTCHAK